MARYPSCTSAVLKLDANRGGLFKLLRSARTLGFEAGDVGSRPRMNRRLDSATFPRFATDAAKLNKRPSTRFNEANVSASMKRSSPFQAAIFVPSLPSLNFNVTTAYSVSLLVCFFLSTGVLAHFGRVTEPTLC